MFQLPLEILFSKELHAAGTIKMRLFGKRKKKNTKTLENKTAK